jgi:hypothetical protein
MNRTLKILIALLVVLGVAYFFISRNGWTTLNRELKDFAIQDTGAVTKIFLADRAGKRVLLEKRNGVWWLDETEKADADKVNLLLGTMHDLQVRNPIPEKEFNQVIAFLASGGTKAEFYAGNDEIKTIYVGPSTPDQTGTFMMIEGSSTPFITHIPGFVGYLSPRFLTEKIKWRSREVFDLGAAEIREVTLVYPQQPSESFRIVNGTTPEMSGNNGTGVSAHWVHEDADANRLKYYLASFRGLYFEGFEEMIAPRSVDSIRARQPLCVLSVLDSKGNTTKLTVHLKPVDRRTKQQTDEEGVKLPYDTEKYFAFLNDRKELLVIQDHAFSRVLKTKSSVSGR